MNDKLIKIGDKTYKEAKVIMLPTKRNNEVGQIVQRPSDKALAIINILTKDDPQECINQHLYIVTSEEIKEGDWCFIYDGLNHTIEKMNEEFRKYVRAEKIIASTDPSLTIKQICSCGATTNEGCSECLEVLPKPSSDFIKKFCELNGDIDKILVECYVTHEGNYDKFLNYKVASDNTISIIKKEDSWNEFNKSLEKLIDDSTLNISDCTYLTSLLEQAGFNPPTKK